MIRDQVKTEIRPLFGTIAHSLADMALLIARANQKLRDMERSLSIEPSHCKWVRGDNGAPVFKRFIGHRRFVFNVTINSISISFGLGSGRWSLWN